MLRAAFGASVAIAFAFGPGAPWVRGLGAIASVVLVLGATRAGVLVALAAWLYLQWPEIAAQPWSALVPLALLTHACAPGSPYGSVRAMGRTDPGGGWSLPAWSRWVAWGAVLALAAVAHALSDDATSPRSALRLAACAAGLFPPVRPFAWLVLAGEEAIANFDAAHAHVFAARLLALGILFDPAWVRGRTGGVERLYYDGACGLCHRAVRFILAEDVDGSRFRVAPLQGETFAARVTPAERANLPDSVIVQAQEGRLLVRSDAALHILERLGGVWRVLGIAGRAFPRPLRDALYDGVARIRKRLFAAPKEACPLLPSALRGRFDP